MARVRLFSDRLALVLAGETEVGELALVCLEGGHPEGSTVRLPVLLGGRDLQARSALSLGTGHSFVPEELEKAWLSDGSGLDPTGALLITDGGAYLRTHGRWAGIPDANCYLDLSNGKVSPNMPASKHAFFVPSWSLVRAAPSGRDEFREVLFSFRGAG